MNRRPPKHRPIFKGMKCNMLTVICRTKRRIQQQVMFLCECECGVLCYVKASTIRRRAQLSCGCMVGKAKGLKWRRSV